MTNLEKIKNKLQKMNVKEMARTIKRIDDACEYCIYESSLCKGNCEFGIEEYLKDEEETESAFVVFDNQEPRKICHGSSIATGYVSLDGHPVVLTFTKKESIDAVIEELKKAKSYMEDKEE